MYNCKRNFEINYIALQLALVLRAVCIRHAFGHVVQQTRLGQPGGPYYVRGFLSINLWWRHFKFNQSLPWLVQLCHSPAAPWCREDGSERRSGFCGQCRLSACQSVGFSFQRLWLYFLPLRRSYFGRRAHPVPVACRSINLATIPPITRKWRESSISCMYVEIEKGNYELLPYDVHVNSNEDRLNIRARLAKAWSQDGATIAT